MSCGDEPLCGSFLPLYTLALSKEAWKVDLWDDLGEGGHLESSCC